MSSKKFVFFNFIFNSKGIVMKKSQKVFFTSLSIITLALSVPTTVNAQQHYQNQSQCYITVRTVQMGIYNNHGQLIGTYPKYINVQVCPPAINYTPNNHYQNYGYSSYSNGYYYNPNAYTQHYRAPTYGHNHSHHRRHYGY